MTLTSTSRDPFGLGKYSRELWQTHAARRQRPSYREVWPTTEYFKAAWTERSAAHLIQGAEQIRNEAAGHHNLPPVPYELLDPAEVEHGNWRELYADELHDHPRIGWQMVQDNPASALLRRFTRPGDEVRPGEAGLLSPLESTALQLWIGGDSYRAIAEATGADPRNCQHRVARGLEKLRLLAARRQPLLSDQQPGDLAS